MYTLVIDGKEARVMSDILRVDMEQRFRGVWKWCDTIDWRNWDEFSEVPAENLAEGWRDDLEDMYGCTLPEFYRVIVVRCIEYVSDDGIEQHIEIRLPEAYGKGMTQQAPPVTGFGMGRQILK